MKWTKLYSTNDHNLDFSLFDMPWQAGVEDESGSSHLKIRYLGPLGSVSRWSDSQGGSVLFQRHPIRVVEVTVPSSKNRLGTEAFVSVVKDFLSAKLRADPEFAAGYLEVIDDAAKKAVESSGS